MTVGCSMRLMLLPEDVEEILWGIRQNFDILSKRTYPCRGDSSYVRVYLDVRRKEPESEVLPSFCSISHGPGFVFLKIVSGDSEKVLNMPTASAKDFAKAIRREADKSEVTR